jgi:hypothetical protein
VSTVPDVKAALVAIFTAALPSADVLYGPRQGVTITKPNIVTVGNALGILGQASLNLREAEDYTIEVTVSASLPGADTQQDVTEVADALWTAARQAIRNPPGGTLAIAGVQSVQPTGEFELTETATSEVRNATIRFGVRVTASN